MAEKRTGLTVPAGILQPTTQLDDPPSEEQGDPKGEAQPVSIAAKTARKNKVQAKSNSGKVEGRKLYLPEDLYFRLSTFAVRLPALRERREDIPQLIRYFAAQVAAQNGWKPAGFSVEAIAALGELPWPGNIRELRNAVERLLLMAEGEVTAETVALAFPQRPGAARGEIADATGPLTERIAAFERATIERALQQSRFNKSKAAKTLGLTRQQLYVRLRRYGLD